MPRTLFKEKDLRESAERLLDFDPDPVPRFLLLRDVLGRGAEDPSLRAAAAIRESSKCVQLLTSSQHPDGTWGRFHTQDTRVKQPFPTTECALRIALENGLDFRHPVIAKALPRILDYVTGARDWPDPPEKHDNPLAWYIWIRHCSAAALSMIERRHRAIDPFRRIRAEATAAAFASGTYDRTAEIRALNSLLDCRMKNPVPFHVMPSLKVLSATEDRLPGKLEEAMLSFLLRHEGGVYYGYGKRLDLVPKADSKGLWVWIRTHGILSRFPSWKSLGAEAMNGQIGRAHV
jgi:hypothetical protein